MSDLNKLVDSYLAVWNEPDGEARHRAIAELWTEDATYTDPLAAVEGRAGIEAVITGARAQLPGFTFNLIGTVDANHNIARFGWEAVPDNGGESLVEGFDVAVATEDGRLRSIYGFLDKVPAA